MIPSRSEDVIDNVNDYIDAMRIAELGGEERRVGRVIEQKERHPREEEDLSEMQLDRTSAPNSRTPRSRNGPAPPASTVFPS